MNLSVTLIASCIFFLSESYLIMKKRSRRKQTKTQKDQRSLLLFWITIPFTLSLGFVLAYHGSWSPSQQGIATLGLLIFAAGMGIRWLAILQLKKEFTVDVAIGSGHQLKTDGIYTRLRHPSYLGLWLCCTGLSIAMNSAYSFLVIAIPLLLAIHYRIRVEEAVLSDEFGEKFADYKSRSARMFPGIY